MCRSSRLMSALSLVLALLLVPACSTIQPNSGPAATLASIRQTSTRVYATTQALGRTQTAVYREVAATLEPTFFAEQQITNAQKETIVAVAMASCIISPAIAVVAVTLALMFALARRLRGKQG